MTPDQTDQQIADRLHSIFPDEETKNRVVDLVTSVRPKGVSRRCHYPYYKRFYADEIKKQIDKMIESKMTIIYRFETWDKVCSRDTLYKRVNQSIRYLLDNLDPNRVYANWYQVVNVHRNYKVMGVAIEFIPEMRGGDIQQPFTGELITPQESTTPKWRTDMDSWLESDSARPFVKERLALSEQEVKDLKMELALLRGIISSIKATGINIIRVKE